MKVFFTASLRGQSDFKKFYNNIYNFIEQLGYKHLDKEIFQLSEKEYYNKIENDGRQAYVDLYNRKMQHLHDADICIFECSLHSLSIGFLIEKSLDFNKPTIVLYYKNNIPHFLAGVENDKLVISNYNDNNLKQVLCDSLEKAKDLRDKRFNFFISPPLLNYLEKASKKQGVTKSTFIRNLILTHRKKTGD